MTDNENTDNTESSHEDGIPTDRRPLGFWLRTVDRLITREFANAFDGEDISRRDWMLLNAVSGTVDAPWLDAVLARRGKRLRSLEARGWIVETDGHWTLTDEGRAAQQRLGETVDGIRAKVAGAVSDEDFATLTASLEAIARELGWDESMPMPRGRRGRFGRRGFGPEHPAFGPGFAGFPGHDPHGFGRGYGHGHPAEVGHHGHPFGDDCAHAHGHHHGRGRRRGGEGRERSFERGFEAGFRAAQRRDAASDTAA